MLIVTCVPCVAFGILKRKMGQSCFWCAALYFFPFHIFMTLAWSKTLIWAKVYRSPSAAISFRNLYSISSIKLYEVLSISCSKLHCKLCFVVNDGPLTCQEANQECHFWLLWAMVHYRLPESRSNSRQIWHF